LPHTCRSQYRSGSVQLVESCHLKGRPFREASTRAYRWAARDPRLLPGHYPRYLCSRRGETDNQQGGSRGSPEPQGVAGLLRAAWLRPKQTDLVPDKGQFRSRFHHPLSYCCPTTIFRDPRNRHRHHLSATLLDGRVGNGWGPVVTMRCDRSDGGFPNAGYEPASVMRRLSLNRSEPAKKSGQNIPKNRCRTT
jgi:hypothetical protein